MINTYTGMKRIRRRHIDRFKKTTTLRLTPKLRLKTLRSLRPPTCFACPGWRDVQRIKDKPERDVCPFLSPVDYSKFHCHVSFRRVLVWRRYLYQFPPETLSHYPSFRRVYPTKPAGGYVGNNDPIASHPNVTFGSKGRHCFLSHRRPPEHSSIHRHTTFLR